MKIKYNKNRKKKSMELYPLYPPATNIIQGKRKNRNFAQKIHLFLGIFRIVRNN